MVVFGVCAGRPAPWGQIRITRMVPLCYASQGRFESSSRCVQSSYGRVDTEGPTWADPGEAGLEPGMMIINARQ